jgi:hypothetical protein
MKQEQSSELFSFWQSVSNFTSNNIEENLKSLNFLEILLKKIKNGKN